MLLRGSCHCQNIRFELDWQPESPEIPARACTCSFCQKHGGIWTSCPKGQLTVVLKDPKAVSIYTFGSKTAEFHVCAKCGAVPVVSSRIDGQLYAVVSVNALDNVDPSRVRRTSTSFDGEEREARLARRVKNWIPRVSFTLSGV